jgi:transposase
VASGTTSARRENPAFFSQWPRARHSCGTPAIAITFHFTPKHAAWINQIEIWFSILVRKLLRRGNFTSKHHLQQRIEGFIAYFNATLANPFRWTMKGKPLVV